MKQAHESLEVYLVGGAVRDKLLGLPVTERDWVVVGATPEEMLARGFKPVGKEFPVFLHPDSKEEYALARKERKIGRGYHGFVFYTDPTVTLEDDLERRDLTINAMAEAEDGELIDLYDGKQDLQQRLLRHVSPAFAEDPVRILRVARFAARYAELGFEVAPETMHLMQTMVASGEVDALVPERVWKEFERALTEKRPSRFIEVLRASAALERLFPQLARLYRSVHPKLNTHSAAELTLCMLDQAAVLQRPVPVRFACLCHLLAQGEIQNLAQTYRLPKEYRELVLLVARHYLDCLQAEELDASTLMAVFTACDAFRQIKRFAAFLATCEIIGKVLGMTEGIKLLRKALQACLGIDSKQIATQTNLQGPQIAERIKQLRLLRLENILSGKK